MDMKQKEEKPDEFTQGIKGGVNKDLDAVKAYLHQMYDKAQKGPIVQDSTLQGFENMVKHPQEAQGYCMGGEVKGYAQGGVVDNDFLGQLNAGTVPGLQFDPKSGLPPAPQMPPQTSQMPLQAPNPTQGYIDNQRAQINKYSPDQQLAVSQDLMKRKNSLGSNLALAGGTLADALMQGVARSGSGGFADRIQGRQDQQAKEQMDALETARKGNLEQVGENQKLDAMDPKSPLSKIAQQTWGPLLAQNGFKPEQVAGMPASIIASLTGQSVEALKAKAEAEMARATLGLKTQEAAQTAKHQTAEEAASTEKDQLDAARTLSGRGMFKKATDAIFGDPGTEALEAKLKGGSAPAIPEGRVTVVSPTGQIGHIPQDQLQSALSQGYKVQ